MSDQRIAQGPSPELHLADTAFMNLDKPYLNGAIDQFSEVRIRIGMIDNPTIKRTENVQTDPLKSDKVVNLATGKVNIKWLEHPGGVIRPPEFSTKSGEDYDDFSSRESISLTHSVMWNGGDNWMGINYMPPVGSIVVVGFRKNNLPVILGFLQQHYQVCEPLKLGEIMISGYGRNSSHWKQNNEQEHKAWIRQGDKDGLGNTSPDTVGLRIRIKAASSSDDDKTDDANNPKDRNNKKGLIELYAYRLENGVMKEASAFEVKPESISLNSFIPEEDVKEEDLKVFNKIELTKDSLNFSSSLTNSTNPFARVASSSKPIKSNINMTNGNMTLAADDGTNENKISVDLGKIQLLSNINGKISEIKIIENDAFFNVSGNMNFNVGKNFNVNAGGVVDIDGTVINLN